MSVTYEFVITKDTASPALAGLAAELSEQRLAAAVGPGVARLVSTHLRNRPPNKRGWPTTNFWAQAARSTNWRPVQGGALVSVNKVGVRQRYFGGPIRPVNARALTIPISPVAYGHTAADFPGAFLLKTSKGAFIVQRSGTADKETKAQRGKRIRGLGGNAKRRLQADLNFLFKLVGGVDQEPDPGVLPDSDALRAAANEGIKAAIIRKLGK